MNKDLIETLRAGRSWEVEAAELIEQLKKENEELRIDNDFVRNKNASLKLKQKQLDEELSGALLVAHMNGASSARIELEKVTKQRDELLVTLERIAANKYTTVCTAGLPPLDQRAVWAEAALASVKGESKCS